MMTTRSRATWDEVKTNPFLQQVRPARIARSLLVSRLIWGARLRYNGGSGRRREWPRALSPSRGDVRARPSRRRTSPFVRKVRIVSSVLGLDDRIEISAA